MSTENMKIHDDFSIVNDRDYIGRILKGNYSKELKKRVAESITCYRLFDKTANPSIIYISAWEGNVKEIWYEYIGRRFLELLKCKSFEVAEVFRNCILDRRVYKYIGEDVDIKKEVRSRSQLDGVRKKLREDVKEKGITDAVYKISLEKDSVIWLKDLAAVETYAKDGVYLSLGCLTVVTKEMRAEEERLERERLQVLLEMAGAVCHEMNQPLQGIYGYSQALLMNMSKDDQRYEKIQKIIELIIRMGQITGKLRGITKYETKDYVQGVKIVDIDKSSKKNILTGS
jgi:phospho-acceptor domain-containing protein